MEQGIVSKALDVLREYEQIESPEDYEAVAEKMADSMKELVKAFSENDEEIKPTVLRFFRDRAIMDVTYVAVCGGKEYRASAKLNTETGLVFNVEDIDWEDFSFCEAEYIEYEDGIRKDVYTPKGYHYSKKIAV